jgi:hypothetical protein
VMTSEQDGQNPIATMMKDQYASEQLLVNSYPVFRSSLTYWSP